MGSGVTVPEVNAPRALALAALLTLPALCARAGPWDGVGDCEESHAEARPARVPGPLARVFLPDSRVTCQLLLGAENQSICLTPPRQTDADEGGAARLSYWIDGRKRAEWDAPADAQGSFTLALGELDGGGLPEIVVILPMGEASQRRSQLYIVTELGHLAGTYEAYDYGGYSGLYRMQGADHCVLLLARREADMLKADWLWLVDGNLVADPALPPVQRPLDAGLRRERDAATGTVRWFTQSSVVWRKSTPSERNLR